MKNNKQRTKNFLKFAAFLLLVVSWSSRAVATEAADAMWTANYWNNKTLSGDPVLQRTEAEVNYDWGVSSPAPGIVNSDNFSVRWRRSIAFAAGNYRFTATTDDGMRVWLDGVLVIDSWWDSQVHSLTYDTFLSGGDHLVEVTYYEAGGQAVAKLSWAATGGSTPGAIANWRGEYFNNLTLAGTPVLVRDDAVINFDWGTGSPAWNQVAADQFSVRWTRSPNFTAGRYRFTVVADDGARLWVNGQLRIDQWHDSIAGTYVVDLDLPEGAVPLKMEYYENVGGAVARLGWERLGGTVNNWRGEYFNNKNLSGTPVLVRDDVSLDFNWGNGSPAAGVVNADGFSVRWTRSLYFNAGRYRFAVTGDDGVRLWVNNQQIINAWSDHEPQTFYGEIDLTGATVPVRLEYYDNTGGARAKLTWTQIATTPPPAPPSTTGTGTVLSYRLNVRYGPGLQYGVITQLQRGQTAQLAGYRSADSSWVQINWNGSTAWISARPAYLTTSVPVSGLPVWTGSVGNTGGAVTEPTGTVAYCYYLNVRTGPGTSYSITTTVPAGTVVTMIGRNSASTWVKVRLANGVTGWMGAGFLVKSVPVSNLPLAN